MRNPNKNTIKRLFKICNGAAAGWGHRYSNYFLFNDVGARLYVMSKGRICNRQQIGYAKYFFRRDAELGVFLQKNSQTQ